MKRVLMMTTAIAFAISAMAQQPTLESGIKMYQYGKYESAEKILSPLSGADKMANYYLGLSYLKAGDLTQADATFRKYPEDPANISGTARVAFEKKDIAGGNLIAKNLAATAKKKEWLPWLYAAEALTYSNGTDNQLAIQWYKDALAKSPNDIETHLGLGDTYVKIQGGGGEAMNNYEFITDKQPQNSVVLTRIGDLWYYAHNYTSALEFYGKAKDADANNPLPYFSLAQTYQRAGNFDKALTNIRKYLSLSDNSMNDRILFCEILYQAKVACEAVKVSKELMNQNPPADKKTELLGILGFSLSDCGDSVEALKYLRQYFHSKPEKEIPPYAYIEFGKLYLKLGMLDSASYFYTKGISGDTARNKTDIYRQIAEAFRTKKDFCSAANWYDQLIKSNPETQAPDYFYRGFSYYYCKNIKAAIEAFISFEKKYPEQPPAYYWHARSQAAIDSEATEGSAVEPFQKWLQLIGPDGEKDPKKKSDVLKAYEYILLYNYNKKDKEQVKVNMEKIKAIDPNDGLMKQIEEAEKTPGSKAGAKPGAAPKKK